MMLWTKAAAQSRSAGGCICVHVACTCACVCMVRAHACACAGGERRRNVLDFCGVGARPRGQLGASRSSAGTPGCRLGGSQRCSCQPATLPPPPAKLRHKRAMHTQSWEGRTTAFICSPVRGACAVGAVSPHHHALLWHGAGAAWPKTLCSGCGTQRLACRMCPLRWRSSTSPCPSSWAFGWVGWGGVRRGSGVVCCACSGLQSEGKG